MRKLVICKACGFIMPESRLRDRCPACGVPAKMFEPYQEKMSEKRKEILSLDIHPILVHFPVAFNFSILVFSVSVFIIKGKILAQLLATMMILIYCLPAVIIAAFLGGLLDGKIRFRRVNTPILVKKIFLGIFFFLISIAMLIVNIFYGIENPSGHIYTVVLSAGGVILSVFLGRYGVSLLSAKFPG